MGTQCLPLHEETFTGVERRELLMLRRLLGERRTHIEQFGKEVFQIRRQRDQQRRFGFGVQTVGCFASGHQLSGQIGCVLRQRGNEQPVEPQQTSLVREVFKAQSVREIEVRHGPGQAVTRGARW